jgi:predicted phosphodiesterase
MVLGNVDRHEADLVGQARRCGVHAEWEVVKVDIGGGRSLAATHGHDEAVLAGLIESGQFAYVCHGHTHRAEDRRVGATRVICPGALHHPRAPRYPSAAILDTQADTVEIVAVEHH